MALYRSGACSGATARTRSESGLSADAVGRHVANAIRNDEYFVFTHPDARARIEERHARMLAGFDAAEDYIAALR